MRWWTVGREDGEGPKYLYLSEKEAVAKYKELIEEDPDNASSYTYQYEPA